MDAKGMPETMIQQMIQQTRSQSAASGSREPYNPRRLVTVDRPYYANHGDSNFTFAAAIEGQCNAFSAQAEYLRYRADEMGRLIKECQKAIEEDTAKAAAIEEEAAKLRALK